MKKISTDNLLIVLLLVVLLTLINLNKVLPYPPADQLIINTIDYLPDWKADLEGIRKISQGPLGGRKTIHTARLSSASTEGVISQDIYQFRSCNDSGNYYSSKTEGSTNQLNTEEWKLLPEISFNSNTANDFEFLCFESAFSSPMVGCSYTAQYGHYVVIFQGSWIMDSSMSYTKFIEMVLAIEEKMSSWYGLCIF